MSKPKEEKVLEIDLSLIRRAVISGLMNAREGKTALESEPWPLNRIAGAFSDRCFWKCMNEPYTTQPYRLGLARVALVQQVEIRFDATCNPCVCDAPDVRLDGRLFQQGHNQTEKA